MAKELRVGGAKHGAIYAIIIREADGATFVPGHGWEADATGERFARCALDLNYSGLTEWTADFPREISAGTAVRIAYRDRTGGRATEDDLPLIQQRRVWDGERLMTADDTDLYLSPEYAMGWLKFGNGTEPEKRRLFAKLRDNPGLRTRPKGNVKEVHAGDWLALCEVMKAKALMKDDWSGQEDPTTEEIEREKAKMRRS